MKDLDDLKKETETDLKSARNQRVDRQARERRDAPILDAYDRMSRGDQVEYQPGPRHLPELRMVELLDDALDEVAATPDQVASTMSRLTTTPAAWATEVRGRAEAARVYRSAPPHPSNRLPYRVSPDDEAMTEYDADVPKDDDKPRMGRPPRTDAAAELVITIRVTAAEKQAWLDAAAGQPLAAWIRDRCNRSAARR